MIKNICYTLGENFPSFKVYREMTCDTEEPFFYVRKIEGRRKCKIGAVYLQKESFEIKCFLKPCETLLEDLEKVANRLYEVLEIMEYDGKKARGYDMKHRLNDGVLLFYLKINHNLIKQENENYFENLSQNIGERKK